MPFSKRNLIKISDKSWIETEGAGREIIILLLKILWQLAAVRRPQSNRSLCLALTSPPERSLLWIKYSSPNRLCSCSSLPVSPKATAQGDSLPDVRHGCKLPWPRQTCSKLCCLEPLTFFHQLKLVELPEAEKLLTVAPHESLFCRVSYTACGWMHSSL